MKNNPRILIIPVLLLLTLLLFSHIPSSNAAIIIEYDVPGGYSSLPREMVFDNNEWLWFTQPGGHKVARFKAGSFREYELASGDYPWGVDFDSTNEVIYYSDNINPKISRITKEGNVRQYSFRADYGSGLKGISVHTDSDNGDEINIWFAAYESHLIGLLNITSTTQELGVWKLLDDSAPESLVFTASTGLWCTDFKEDKIWNIPNSTSPNVKYVDLPDDSEPVDIDVDSFGNLWLTLSGRNSIGKYNPRLNELTEYKIPTSFSSPWGITIDYSNRVWFTESASNKIGFFNPDSGTFVEYSRRGPGSPTYLATFREGDTTRLLPIFFSDTDYGKIGKIDPHEGFTTTFVGSLTGATTTSSTGFSTSSLTHTSNSSITTVTSKADEDATDATETTTYTETETVKIVRTSTSDITTMFTTITGTTSTLTTINGTSTSYIATATGTSTTTSFATSTSYIATETGTITTYETTTSFTTRYETTTTGLIIIPGYQPNAIIYGLIIGFFILGWRARANTDKKQVKKKN